MRTATWIVVISLISPKRDHVIMVFIVIHYDIFNMLYCYS